MTYPYTPPRPAPVRTAQVTRTGAVLLNRIADVRAVHACELVGHEDEVFSLLNEQLLLCRPSRLGQVLSLSAGARQHLGLPGRKVMSPEVAQNSVYERAALNTLLTREFRVVRSIRLGLMEVSDGHRTHWLYADGSTNIPSTLRVEKVLMQARQFCITGQVIVMADCLVGFQARASPSVAFEELPFASVPLRLPPIRV